MLGFRAEGLWAERFSVWWCRASVTSLLPEDEIKGDKEVPLEGTLNPFPLYNVGPALLGGVALKSIWRNYSGSPDCLRGPL